MENTDQDAVPVTVVELLEAEGGQKKSFKKGNFHWFGETVQSTYLAEEKTLYFRVATLFSPTIGMALPVAGRVLGRMTAEYMQKNIQLVVLEGPDTKADRNPEGVTFSLSELLYIREYANTVGAAAHFDLPAYDELHAARRPFVETFIRIGGEKSATKASGASGLHLL